MWNCHSWPLDATTRGVDLPADLQIWPLTVEMWNCHSWPLDATTWGVDLPLDLQIWANISSNSRNVISPFLTTRCQYWGGRSASRSASWSANMTSNSRNVKLPFLTTRCHYWGVGPASRSASWSANMTSNSRNVISPSLSTRCQLQGADLPCDLPIWALTVEMWNHHSWLLDSSTGG